MRGFRLHFAGGIFLRSLACILPLVAFPCLGNQAEPSEPLVIRHVALIDMISAAPRLDMDVVVEGERITAIRKSRSAPVPLHARLVEARNKFLIPGLWDMHVHVADAKTFFPLFVANGVTGVRDMGMDLEKLKTWREGVRSGSMVGPHIVLSGPILDGPHTILPGLALVVTRPEEARETVYDLKGQNVDFIKVYNFLSRDTYFAIAEEAKKDHLPFAGHVPISVSAMEAADAGQHSIEHLTGVLLNCSTEEAKLRAEIQKAVEDKRFSPAFVNRLLFSSPPPQLSETFSESKARRLFADFVRNETWQVPTLVVLRAISYGNDRDFQEKQREKLAYVLPRIREDWSRAHFHGRSAAEDIAREKLFQKELELVGDMSHAGVPIMAGTDTPNPYVFAGFSLHDELALLVQAGLTPFEALKSATFNPAKYLGLLKSAGTIEVGKEADLVLLEDDPLVDIRNIVKIAAVVIGGKVFERRDLDSMLDEVKMSVIRDASANENYQPRKSTHRLGATQNEPEEEKPCRRALNE